MTSRRGIRARVLEGEGPKAEANSSSAGQPQEPRRGGIKKRALAEEVAPPVEDAPPRGVKRRALNADAPEPELPFNAAMRKGLATGLLQSPKVFEYAHKATAQGMVGAAKLDKTPSDNNAYRALRSALGWPSRAPQFTWLETRSSRGKRGTIPVICPIAYIEATQQKSEEFSARIKGKDGDIMKFWEGMGNHPIRRGVFGEGGEFGKDAALGLHGDGAPTTKTEGLFTISWNSAHATGNTSQTRNVYAMLPKTAVDDGTLLAVWDYLAWACNALLAGRIPPRDHNGKGHPEGGRKIAKGWRFAMVQVRGDWEFYSEVLKLPRWDAVPSVCWMCYVKQGEGLPNNQLWTTVEDGGWRSAPTISHEQFLAHLRTANLEAHPVSNIVCLRIEGVMTDVLHILDQGCTWHVICNDL